MTRRRTPSDIPQSSGSDTSGPHALSSPGRTNRIRWTKWSSLGIRSRVMVIFALGAAALSLTMATVSYFTTRQYILHQREQAILSQVRSNASLVQSSVPVTAKAQIPQLLTSLDAATSGSTSVLELDGVCYFGAGRVSESCSQALPRGLYRLVSRGTPADQHISSRGSVDLVVGVPIPNIDAIYFESFDLGEENRTLRVLALVLGGTAAFTTFVGAAIGRWASRRVLQPLSAVAKAAETIAGGDLATRMAAEGDRDLAALAASFNRMADALQERIAREARFASDVSHELRSPLTTLANSLELLERHREELPVRARQALGLLGADLRRFQQMVDDLLEISRFDTGSADLLLDEVEVGELIRHATSTGGAQGINMVIDPRVNHVRVLLDKRRVDRVLANLVSNSARYAGGASSLEAEPGDPGTIRLVVVDNGPGVPMEERTRIFERFYRGQESRRRGATDGTGLGLSLVAEHVRLHGGKVWVEDGQAGQTRFVVQIPVHDTATTSQDETPT